ncbi:GGDEF domain-containing protein [Halarcobacter ebronensis]|uniref:diguanylate cyclase n=1 Tax=Halarcobacter ebronensis TaxID=1462615 RepID=A0A4Q0YF99_9BACT|nr:GGDEF domain-containing protein [Halarcobacter ebronensis]RXJ68873.1 GGDEF domain-containing protein [Halarcobacter ebronensis]
MKTKNKIILLVISVIVFMFLLITADMIYNFREYGIKSIDDKAHAIAKTVEHSLTSQMVTGVIQERELFLSQLKNIPNIDKIWLSRSQKVVELYGKGLSTEVVKDKVDEEVLRTGEIKKVIDENIFSQSFYRITIPYKATSKGKINCINCHTNASEGDTLGAITIQMSIDGSKEIGIKTITNTIVIALILTIAIIFILNFIISPFLSLFDSIKKVMNKAQKGDYSYRIVGINNKEAEDVSLWINGLLEKLESTLDSIDSKISIFLSANQKNKEKDHLINVKNTVERLSDVYKFRKTIEYDETLEEVYSRLAQVIKEKIGVENFNFFEANTQNGEIALVYKEKEIFCNIFKDGCRADRTNSMIDSTQFKNVCPSCGAHEGKNYFCIPYSISNEFDLIISIYAKDEIEVERFQKEYDYIKDYVDVAKTVIISKKLMKILEKNAQTDVLTNLYNRKFLEDNIKKISAQVNRSGITYGILMIDIDFFKIINDTYGHDIGDNAIKVVTEILTENTRKSDVAIRYGGEEFLILLYNCDDKFVLSVAEKIKLAFSRRDIQTGGTTTIRKTLSIGTSIYPNDSKDLKEAIKYADLALYKAKNSGRNCVVKFVPELKNLQHKSK